MSRFYSYLRIALLVRLVLPPVPLYAEENIGQEDGGSTLSVRITEVQWAGTVRSTADEWLEISAHSFLDAAEFESLRGWSIRLVKDGVETPMVQIESDIHIKNKESIVIANYSAEQSCLDMEPAYVTTAVSLPNTKLLIRLYNAHGILVDEVDDGIGSPFAGINTSALKTSMEKVDFSSDGRAESNWLDSYTKSGIDEDCSMLGTPGSFQWSAVPDDDNDDDAALIPTIESSRAYGLGGSIIADWSLSTDNHLYNQHIEYRSTEHALITSVLLEPNSRSFKFDAQYQSGSYLLHQFIKDGVSISTGSIITIQPLHKPIINEVLPNPKGDDETEWIELHNPLATNLDLYGWVLSVGSKSYQFPEGTGSILQPAEYRVFAKEQTGLTLRNAGDTISLSLHDQFLDTMPYPELPEGVSFGRDDQASETPYCVASPHTKNEVVQPAIKIEGIPQDVSSFSSVNLSAIAQVGTLEGAKCTWQFSDGYSYEGCNPPSHKIETQNTVEIFLELKDYCGTTVTQSINIYLNGENKNIQKNILEQESDAMCKPTIFSGIAISEFLAAPSSANDEWIELYNDRDTAAQLCGWQVDDQAGGSAPYNLESYIIHPQSYLLLPRSLTKIALNNDNDSVRLIAPLPEGGTGVLLSIPYAHAPKNESYVLTNAGSFQFTPFMTPGDSNRFVEYVPAQPTVVLSKALPNPRGVDTYDEWVEFENTSMAPQWLNGWTLQTLSGARLPLDGIVIPRKSTYRLSLYKSGLSLRNTDGSLLLYDREHQLRSTLYWESAKEGKVIQRMLPSIEFELDELKVGDDGMFSFRIIEDPMAYRKKKLTLTGSIAGIHFMKDSVEYVKYKNTFKALINNKKIELKNRTDKNEFMVVADGIDIGEELLLSGVAYLSGGVDDELKSAYRLYEAEARRLNRGIWAFAETAVAVEAAKEQERQYAVLEKEGLTLTLSKKSGLVEKGAVIEVDTNVPADLFIAYNDKAPIPFDGTFALWNDQDVSITAMYKDSIANSTRTTVVIQQYILKKERYEPCFSIEEIYPSPGKGEEEWVEIMNNCNGPQNLLGWSIDDEPDGGSKAFTFGSGRVIGVGERLVLSGALLKVALNNSGDAVVMRSPAGQVVDSVWYPSIKKGVSYMRVGEGWCLSLESTPGVENECVPIPEKASKAKKVSVKKSVIGVGTRWVYQFEGVLEAVKGVLDVHNFTLFRSLEIGDNVNFDLIFIGIALFISVLMILTKKYIKL